MSNLISEKERLAKETKDRKKWPATKQISLIYLGINNEKRSRPATGGDKKGHEQIFGAPSSSASGDNQSQ